MPEGFGSAHPNAVRLVKRVYAGVGFPHPARPIERHKWRPLRGGAPLPIPNREVKPRRDDDTAGDRGKVVRRPPLTETLHQPR